MIRSQDNSLRPLWHAALVLALLVPATSACQSFFPDAKQSDGGAESTDAHSEFVDAAAIDAGPDLDAPRVLFTSPAAGAEQVAPGSVVYLQFSEDVDPSTVDSSSAQLRDDLDMMISTAIVVDGSSVTLTPTAPLSLDASYSVVLSTAIQDVAGNPLAAELSWSFTVHEGGWGSAEFLDDGTGLALFRPDLAFDSEGNAMAIWEQLGDGAYSIWSNRFVKGIGWGAAELVEASGGPDAGAQRIAFDAQGNAVAIWAQRENVFFDIWSNRYTPDVGWGTPERIESVDEEAFSPRIAIDASGGVLAVWEVGEPALTGSKIWWNRYEPGVGWGSAAPLDPGNTSQDATSPRVAVDAAGNALVVYSRESQIMTAEFSPASGWSSPTQLGTGNRADLAMSSSGVATAVWAGSDVQAARFAPGQGWSAAEIIEQQTSTLVGDALVLMDQGGGAVALWEQSNGSEIRIWSNRYSVQSGWASAADVSGGVGREPSLSMDASGNVAALWRQGSTIRTSRSHFGFGWDAPETLGSSDAAGLVIALDPAGNGRAAWANSARLETKGRE